ncbi:hypothetical protein JD522_00515 [Aeromonas hydrophila]|uniref:hypothetical protein n=1 Tax=Aeromonas hydrophila TaxID=644 RepID=UPI00191D003D|nr:hypothetical protein [Aeromonas hydrophila]MBL0571922.1 hypothetical protein [Aeromonas hydrophila]
MDFKKLIEDNLTLSVLGFLFTGATAGFGFSEIIRVEGKNVEIQSLNNKIDELKYTLSEKEATVKILNDEAAPFKDALSNLALKNKEIDTKLTYCNGEIDKWSKALDEWKNAYKKTKIELNGCESNSNIMSKIKDIELKKSNVESRLYSALGNDLDKESVPFYQRQALEYQTRLVELEKKLIPSK